MIGAALSGQLGGATFGMLGHCSCVPTLMFLHANALANTAAAAAHAVVQVGPYLQALQPFASLSHLALLALAGR